MFSICKYTHPPTAVEHAISCHFFNRNEKSLVVAGANIIRVFRLIPDADPKKKEMFSVKHPPKMKLECVCTFSLFGNVMSIQSVALASSPRDALLLSFRDAKLSVVEYDPEIHDLRTLSLHYFEDEDMRGGWTHHHHIPMVRVDPEGRCAVMTVYGRKLVVLPFRRDVPADDPTHPGLGSSHNDSTNSPSRNSSSYAASMGGGVTPGSSKANSVVLSSYLVVLKDLDEKMDNVIDVQFLHGYYEPTLLILYEPVRTFPGRIAVRRDTCSLVAISLNIQQRVHPIIWSVSGLPFDCLQAVPIRRPIGGTLVLAANALLYLNQSVPPYAVSLNSVADSSSNFPLKVQEGVRITLEGAQTSFLSHDRLVLSLKGGELYVLTLYADSMRSVRGFHFDKAAASVLTTCMCLCEEGYLFLGSRLGNSLLLRFTEKELSTGSVDGEANTQVSTKSAASNAESAGKKKRLDTLGLSRSLSLGDWMASDVSDIKDLDELEVYGSEDQTSVLIASYVFEVCDSLLNIGPCGDISMGEPAFLSEEFSNVQDPDMELVTTSGYGKNGALCVLQQSIRPQVVTTFELPGCIDMWTVIGSGAANTKPADTETTGTEELMHAFMILSRPDSTMILQTGQEINEVDNSGFSTQGPTVFAGNIGSNRYIIQVSQMGVRLLQGVEQVQHMPLDVGSPVIHASSADPHVAILGRDGQVILLTLREARPTIGGQQQPAKLTVTRPPPQVEAGSRIVTLCAYRDVSGLFSTSGPEGDQSVSPGAMNAGTTTPNKASSNATNKVGGTFIKREIDDEDEMLYGESEITIFDHPLPTPMSEIKRERNNDVGDESTNTASPWWQRHFKEVKPTYWLLLARENGNLEIYSLADFRPYFLARGLAPGPKVLIDTLGATPMPVGPITIDDDDDDMTSIGHNSSMSGSARANLGDGIHGEYQSIQIRELLMVALGHHGGRPLLLVRLDSDDLLLYEAFPFARGSLQLRFRRIHHGLLTREVGSSRSSSGHAKRRKKDESVDGSLNADRMSRACQLRYFSNIAGYNGVFICGPHPHWLFLTSRGELRAHPMSIDGPITCFAPFHNVNCPQGFLYFNQKAELRICVLPTHLSYDAPWPVRKVPLRCTPHFVTYHLESKTYCVVTSLAEPSNKVYKFNGEDKELSVEERGERFPYPLQERFSVLLFSPVSWEVIPNTKMDLEEWEHVTCLKNVSLAYEGTRSGLKGYIALGTNYNYGEDVTSRGRILIFDIIEVVPEPGQPLTKNRFKMVYSKEQKGPVTAITHVVGFLVSAVGQKIYIWQLKDNDLVGIAFIDTQVYIHQMLSIKCLILIADVYKSISLLRFQEEYRTLSLVSRDYRPTEVYTIEFLLDNTQMGFLVSDGEKNLVLYMYQPESRESYGGQRLLRRADFHLGQHVNTFFRVRCKQVEASPERPLTVSPERRHITMFATLDGGIGYLMPVPEKTYRRLLMLQNVLINHIPHTAGLNPKAFRTFKSSTKLLSNPARGVIDGELAWLFLGLPHAEKQEVARKIGTKVDEMIEDLADIDRLTSHF
ncbi:cleavage and polyadenylation specificity factor subunit 1 isoform X1 [Ischnura elegans]|uniref:cleavage and polyadenylation specificity factor subunit 1 isoform X1 n=1 Tax=Ischnura elegans TaxID=197161 RepID=UPI001ED895A9|nr:cleavage and polyadenylation specificity factor subunit 1 isoform X1 [Ischnura elegans]